MTQLHFVSVSLKQGEKKQRQNKHLLSGALKGELSDTVAPRVGLFQEDSPLTGRNPEEDQAYVTFM